ncbi:MAG: polyribonucleotide nucleotidyltransferase [Candidatus Dormibacteria bacterium]
MTTQKIEFQVGDQQVLVETGELAQLASGAVTIRAGDTMLLVTAVGTRAPREGIDFFPLTCDFEEKLYAGGKIPGGFLRREGRPTETGILACRLMDRPLRPLFPKGYRNDVQVVATVLSVDQVNDPTILAINGASAALTVSDVPFMGPVGAVRIGLIDGAFVVNPPMAKMEESLLDLVVAGTDEAIMMVEAGARFVSEDQVVEALQIAHDAIRRSVAAQRDLAARLGVQKREFVPPVADPVLESAVQQKLAGAIDSAIYDHPGKGERDDAVSALRATVVTELGELHPDRTKEIGALVDAAVKARVRERILEESRRSDGRGLRDIRPLSGRVGLLPRTHGSALFTRGSTQALSIVTLGSVQDKQKLDGLGLEVSKRFMHHYNFPAFSVGEARPSRGPGRREIGHGALAERAIAPVLPGEEDFPYTVRIVSEILSSNGSTSMASVCGSTLALMDAGVPIKEPVAGIAMGLVSKDGKFAILTDIQGVEDALGDMDFKVAGTRDGITALQMDIKVQGLTASLLRDALAQAKEARLKILDTIVATIPAPRAEMSQYAPRIITIQINPDKIRDIIGPGGKVIRKMVEDFGVSIDVEDDGRVFIASTDAVAAQGAIDRIRGLTDEVEVGRIYRGKVVRIMSFGAFCQILPNQDGLVHISHLEDHRVNRVQDVVTEGDEIWVKVIEIDDKGRVNLSRKDAIAELKRLGSPTDEILNPLPPDAVVPEPVGAGGGFRGGGRDRGRR